MVKIFLGLFENKLYRFNDLHEGQSEAGPLSVQWLSFIML